MLRGLFLAVVVLLTTRGLTQKTLTALKSVQAPVIDGKLNDDAWLAAPVATDFIQNSPNYGQPSTVKTEVRILYDDNAIYIAAHLFDKPSLVRQQFTTRDGEQMQNTDYFSVFFDTYNDQQNGFQFLVTPVNVQTDAKLNASADVGYGSYGDRSWDAVWQSKTSFTTDGWLVEMRIPYLSLRFSPATTQTWGLQFLRYIRRDNEVLFWNPVNPAENGFINQFGKLTNLNSIQPPLRLSLSPYLSGGVRYNPEGYGKRREVLHSGGMDVKYGINESFTLDATLIPDFGQVVSDNLVNNLTPYEQYYQENRPFFTEGTELFKKSGLFYSRRIGAIPDGYYNVEGLADYTVLKNPSLTQLYNGIKLSGRTQNKLGIGVFNAVTAPMKASLTNNRTGKDTSIATSLLTNYNLVVLDQALKGRSSITFTNTNVLRNAEGRDANVSSLDLNFFTKNNKYQLQLIGQYSKIFGYSPLPDLDYSAYGINLINDTVRVNNKLLVKPYSGFKSILYFGKVSGRWQYDLTTRVTSDKFDPNDMGYLQAPNDVVYDASVSYKQLTATEKFVNYRYSLGTRYTSMFNPYAFNQYEIYGTAFWLFKNFWDVTLYAGSQPFETHDYFELRTPNRYLKKPGFSYFSAVGSTDSRKKFFVNYAAGGGRYNMDDGWYYTATLGLRYRFNNRFLLSVSVDRTDVLNEIGYAFLRESNGEPIIGFRRNQQTSTIVNGTYTFTSRLNFTVRTRHYWNQVRYNDFFNVNADGSYTKRAFIPNQDENYTLFNVDAFLNWDFRLGSRVTVGYKNWLGNPYAVMNSNNYLQNLKGSLTIPHGNELTVKLIYFLDYNQFRKKYQ